MTVKQAWEHFEVHMMLPRKRAEEMGWLFFWSSAGDFVFQRYAGKLRFKFVINEGKS